MDEDDEINLPPHGQLSPALREAMKRNIPAETFANPDMPPPRQFLSAGRRRLAEIKHVILILALKGPVTRGNLAARRISEDELDRLGPVAASAAIESNPDLADRIRAAFPELPSPIPTATAEEETSL